MCKVEDQWSMHDDGDRGLEKTTKKSYPKIIWKCMNRYHWK
jgi:hypothetical protein